MKRFALLLALFGVLLGAALLAHTHSTSLHAQTNDPLPLVSLPVTGYFEALYLADDVPYAVARGKFANTDNVYHTAVYLPQDVLATSGITVQEVVNYAGTTYVRNDTNPRWYETSASVPTIPVLANDMRVIIEAASQADDTRIETTLLRTETFSDIVASRYQIMMYEQDERAAGAVDDTTRIDMWIGQNDSIVHLLQVTLPLVPGDPEAGEFVALFRYYNLNDPLVEVALPPAVVPFGSVRQRGENTVQAAEATPTEAARLVPALTPQGLAGPLPWAPTMGGNPTQ